MACLQLEYLPGWLFGVTPSKARPELRAKLTRYREECFAVLWRAFQAEIPQASGSAATSSSLSSTSASAAALVQVREIALAVAAMAEQQLALQEQVGTAHQRLDRAASVVGDLQRRVSIVEERTAPAEYFSEAQAMEISARVKALAELLTEHDASHSHYQGVFGELYRRFGVSGYKAIRRGQYEHVQAFLEDWRQAAIRGGKQP